MTDEKGSKYIKAVVLLIALLFGFYKDIYRFLVAWEIVSIAEHFIQTIEKLNKYIGGHGLLLLLGVCVFIIIIQLFWIIFQRQKLIDSYDKLNKVSEEIDGYLKLNEVNEDLIRQKEKLINDLKGAKYNFSLIWFAVRVNPKTEKKILEPILIRMRDLLPEEGRPDYKITLAIPQEDGHFRFPASFNVPDARRIDRFRDTASWSPHPISFFGEGFYRLRWGSKMRLALVMNNNNRSYDESVPSPDYERGQEHLVIAFRRNPEYGADQLNSAVISISSTTSRIFSDHGDGDHWEEVLSGCIDTLCVLLEISEMKPTKRRGPVRRRKEKAGLNRPENPGDWQ